MVKEQTEAPGKVVDKKSSDISEPKNQGKLILDATSAPADIKYPNDLGILNQAREQTETIIDALHSQIHSPVKKNKNLSKPSQKRILDSSKETKTLTKKTKKSD